MDRKEGLTYWKQVDFDACPFCDFQDEFLEGPHGGCSVNFKCNICGAKFNDLGPFGVELIGWPEKSPLQINTIKNLDHKKQIQVNA